MNKRILLIQGHLDSGNRHLCHGLEDAYGEGASAGGHDVRRIAVGELDFPTLRSQKAWEHGALPPELKVSQEQIHWAEHIVIFFPLWLGDMPALLKAFLEQVARPGFAFTRKEGNSFGAKGLRGQIGKSGCHHGHAGGGVSLVLQGAQRPFDGTQHTGLCRHCPGR